MGDHESSELIEAALDFFVYAPLGLAVSCTDVVPDLAQRGRHHVRNAQAIGKFAIDSGQHKVGAVLNDPDSPMGDILRGLGLLTDTPPGPTNRGGEPTDPPEVPIAGYDQLTAAEIVPLLPALGTDDLQLVLEHEQAGRSRKTILNRIGQLQSRSR
ncbi:MAG: hypothetical protein GY929_12930 [Actinomycetia bacterium]|nr:hypothetical protein [Actinomycetes bacterium]